MNLAVSANASAFSCFLLAILLGPSSAQAGGINFDYIELDRGRVYSEGQDFDSWGELKSSVNRVFADYECPTCKGHQCTGRYVNVLVRKVDIYREVEKTGFFGGKKKVDEFVKTAWRIEDVTLKQRDGGWGILSDESEGLIACSRKGCGWQIRGGTRPPDDASVRWLTVGDILSGKF
jgi:hypothetical protein